MPARNRAAIAVLLAIGLEPFHPRTVGAAPTWTAPTVLLLTTTDLGTTWNAIAVTGLPLSSWLLGADPNVPSVWYASGPASDLYRSVDAGLTWTPLGMSGALVFGRAAPTTLYVKKTDSTDTTEFGNVYRSIDHGTSWVKLFRLPHPGASLVVNPVDSSRLYSFAGEIAVTTDAGVHWTIEAAYDYLHFDGGYLDLGFDTSTDPPGAFALGDGNFGFDFLQVFEGGGCWSRGTGSMPPTDSYFVAGAAGMFVVPYNGQAPWSSRVLQLRDCIFSTQITPSPLLEGFPGFWADPVHPHLLAEGYYLETIANASFPLLRSVDGGITWSIVARWPSTVSYYYPDLHFIGDAPGTIASIVTYVPQPPPIISGVSTRHGSPGTRVPIYMESPNVSYLPWMHPSVSFGGVSVPARLDYITVADAVLGATVKWYLDVIVPSHASGPVDVVVTTFDGQTAVLPNGFTYDAPPSVRIGADKTSPQSVGTTVLFTALASGGVAPLQYKWWVFDGSAWTVLRDWSTASAVGWAPSTANAAYLVDVWVRSDGDTANVPEGDAAMSFPITATRVSALSLSADKTAPQRPGSIVTFTATATGGLAPLEYKWWIYNGVAWTIARDWAIANTFSWTPTVANANYVVDVWVRSHGSTTDSAEADMAKGFAIAGAGHAAGSDFNGDGRSDPGIYRPTVTPNALWYSPPTGGGTPFQIFFGTAGDIPVAADYDGDGKADAAIWRPSTGLWYGRTGAGTIVIQLALGQDGDIPVPCDYDGDGAVDPAIYRPSTGLWFGTRANGGTVVLNTNLGVGGGDIPVPADYNGDGKCDPGIMRPGVGPGGTNLWYSVPSGGGSPFQIYFGAAGDIPAPADYDGDGKADAVIFRPSTGLWYGPRTGAAQIVTQFILGQSGDIPVPGDYNGDGATDPAVYRPSTGLFFGTNAAGNTIVLNTNLGVTAGDIPTGQRPRYQTANPFVSTQGGSAVLPQLSPLLRDQFD